MQRLFLIFSLLLGLKLSAQTIILVDIGYDNRIEVGRELRAIAMHQPKLIAIDVHYLNDSLSLDTVLVKAIQQSGNVLMAAKLHHIDVPYPFWDSLELPHEKFNSKYIGFSNMYGDNGVVVPEIPIKESYKGRLLPSFSYEVARRSEPNLRPIHLRSIKIKRLKKPTYQIVKGKDLLKLSTLEVDFKNKIVIFGVQGKKHKLKGGRIISGIELQASFIDYLIRHYTY